MAGSLPCDRVRHPALGREDGPDGAASGRFALRSSLDHTFLAEGWATGCWLRARRVILGRVEHGIEGIEPAFDGLVAARRQDDKIASARRCDVGDPDCFSTISLHLQVARFLQLNGRRATERFQPQGTCRIDVPVRVARGRGGHVGSARSPPEIRAFRFVDGHHPHAFGPFLDYRRFVDIPMLCFLLDTLDERPERGSASLEMTGHVDQPLAVRERLLAILPECDPGMRPHGL